jgi:hypothetical protein
MEAMMSVHFEGEKKEIIKKKTKRKTPSSRKESRANKPPCHLPSKTQKMGSFY